MGIVDKKINKWFSRKLIVWATTTALLLCDKVDSEQWVAIALAYIGSQGVADIAAKWKGA
tara:strand:+ start:186 stop:365 length:180 start_codon:yes stop_codon:yes gene_type:complete